MLLTGCSSTKDFHSYRSDKTYIIDTDYDQVWDEVIDYVSERNYEITNIEKESGLITIKPFSTILSTNIVAFMLLAIGIFV